MLAKAGDPAHVFKQPTSVTAACEQTGLISNHRKRPYSRQMGGEKQLEVQPGDLPSTPTGIMSAEQAAPVLVHCGPAVLKFQQDES